MENRRMNYEDCYITRSLKYKDITKTLLEWSKEVNLPISLLRGRYNAGWSAREILETPYKCKEI